MAAALLAHTFQQLGQAVAVAEAGSLAIVLENARFFQLFPSRGDPDEPLPDRIPELDAATLRDRLSRGRPFRVDLEVKAGPRTVSLELGVRAETVEGSDYVIVECRDTSKQKEAEYMLDSYSRMAERNARELQREKERVEKLLLNVMPRTVYEEMKDFGTVTPQKFEAASVMMLDFVGFTEMAVSRDPAATIAELNDIFTALDRIVELFGGERIKTIGDAYMAVSGVPDANTDHAHHIAKVALRARRYLERRNTAHPHQWRCRIGIHTGALIGSLVGIQKYVYDVFGPAVNLAARLEQVAEPMQILLTADTARLLETDFRLEEVGILDVQGFGRQTIFALLDERAR